MEIKVIFHIIGKSAEAKLLNPDFLNFFIACNWWQDAIEKFSKFRNLPPIFKKCFSSTAAYGKPVKIFHSRWVLYIVVNINN